MPRIHRSPYPDPVVPDVLLGEYVLAPAAGYGDRAALIDAETGAVTSYSDLVSGVRGRAAGLAAAGIRPGDVVALISHNQPAWAVAFHAVIAAGAVVTPVNPVFTEDEVAGQLRLSGARAVIAATAVASKAEAAAAASGIADVFVMESDSFDHVMLADSEPLQIELDPSRALAVLPFSSGTTGVPKGVMLTHRNLVANLEQHRPVLHVEPADVLCAALPFFHIYGLSMILNTGLRYGASIVTMRKFNFESFLDVVETYGVTKLQLVPPMVLSLASSPAVMARDLSSVRTAMCGAAPLDATAVEQTVTRIGVRIGQGYGMTEASPGLHFVPEDRLDESPAGSIGVLLPGTEARVVSVETGEDTEGAGELLVRGPQVMAGYQGAADHTRAAISDDGWMRTGDIVRVDSDGWWWVVDRLKELIKYKGYQVAPAELEALILGHPQVADAAVVGVPDPTAGEIPVAWVVAGDELDGDQLMAWVATRVAPYKRIRAVHFIDVIPRSPSGKILRRVLRDQ